jgi:hypothetical protein
MTDHPNPNAMHERDPSVEEEEIEIRYAAVKCNAIRSRRNRIKKEQR